MIVSRVSHLLLRVHFIFGSGLFGHGCCCMWIFLAPFKENVVCSEWCTCTLSKCNHLDGVHGDLSLHTTFWLNGAGKIHIQLHPWHLIRTTTATPGMTICRNYGSCMHNLESLSPLYLTMDSVCGFWASRVLLIAGVHYIKVYPYHPSLNGLAERAAWIFKHGLRNCTTVNTCQNRVTSIWI